MTDSGALDSSASDSGAFDSGAFDSGASSGAVDLRPYWPSDGGEQAYRRADGNIFGWYRFSTHEADDFTRLYSVRFDQGAPGELRTWQKTYPNGEGRCTATYAQLWFGVDGSILEVGDWFNSAPCGQPDAFVAFGYASLDGSVNSGLSWSPPAGVSRTPSAVVEVQVLRQNTPSDPYLYAGHDAYSAVQLLAEYDEWRAPYGRNAAGAWTEGAGRTYRDVVQIVLFHGTRSPEIANGSRAPVRCDATQTDGDYPRAALYRTFSNYESYAIEVYLARGVGVVKEALLFTEADYWGASNVCAGAVMGFAHESAEASWSWVLDAP